MPSNMPSKLIAAALVTAALVASPAAHAQQFINVLTGGTSGVYYPLGVAIGKIYSDKIPEREDPGAGHQGLGRESHSAAAGPRRDRVHARRFAESRLGRRHRGRLQDQARQAAHHRRDLSELHPDRRHRRERHQDPGRPQGQEPVGRRAEIRHRTQFARHPGRGGPQLQGPRQGRVSAVRRIRRPDEEPPARRDAAIGRSRGGVAEGSAQLDAKSAWCRFPRRWSTRSGRPSWR